MKNAAIVAPNPAFVSTPKTGTPGQPEPQHLGLGPTGRVHRGGRASSGIPDNEAFWKTVNAVTFPSSRGSGRRSVYRAVAWHVALTDERVCFASVETISKRADMGATQARVHLHALVEDGYLVVEGKRSGGRNATSYCMTNQAGNGGTHLVSTPNPPVTVSQPSGYRSVNPPVTGAEVVSEVVKEVQAAAAGTRSTDQAETKHGDRGHNFVSPEHEKPQAETVETESNFASCEISAKPARHTCPCGHSWPREYGTVCFSPSCNQPKGSAHNAGMAAPVPGKYDGLWDDTPAPRGLQEEYADRYRIAHEPAAEEDAKALAKLGDLIYQAPKAKGARGQLKGKMASGWYRRDPPEKTVQTLAEQGVDKKTANEEAPVAKRPWAEPKRPWKFQRVDGSWE